MSEDRQSFQSGLDRNEVVRLLEAHDISPTQQRVDIAAAMLVRAQHLSADELLALVNRNGPVVSKATVYNTLNLFARSGLVREVIVDPAKVFYDSNTRPHHHFYNQSTGRLLDIEDERIDVGNIPDVPAGTVVDGVEVIIRIRNQDAEDVD